jgi:hypothetical protein
MVQTVRVPVKVFVTHNCIQSLAAKATWIQKYTTIRFGDQLQLIVYSRNYMCCHVVVQLVEALCYGRSRVRFSIVSLEFFIDYYLLAALWPWAQLGF